MPVDIPVFPLDPTMRNSDYLTMTPQKNDPSTTGCARCERLPDQLPESGTLYLAPPMIHTANEIRGYFESIGLEYSEPYEGIFAARFHPKELGRLCNEFLCNVSELELKDSKALILATDETLHIHHLTQMQPLQSIVSRVRGEWLFEVLDEGRIYSHFHPIVEANNPASVFGYECLARAKSEDGENIRPDIMFDIARQTDMLFHLDRACRLAAINGCIEHNLNKSIFVNFNPATIYNPLYCLQTTMEAIHAANLSPDQIVFEVVESEEVRDVDHLLGILNYYRDNGFKVALDDLGAGFSSLNLLSRLKPDFVKLDINLIRDVDTNRYTSVITENLLTMAQKLDIKTIAEGVETVGEWRWLADHGADYIQGFLFAKPAAPPEAVTVPEY